MSVLKLEGFWTLSVAVTLAVFLVCALFGWAFTAHQSKSAKDWRQSQSPSARVGSPEVTPSRPGVFVDVSTASTSLWDRPLATGDVPAERWWTDDDVRDGVSTDGGLWGVASLIAELEAGKPVTAIVLGSSIVQVRCTLPCVCRLDCINVQLQALCCRSLQGTTVQAGKPGLAAQHSSPRSSACLCSSPTPRTPTCIQTPAQPCPPA